MARKQLSDINANNHKVTNLGTATNTGDAVNKGQMDTALALKVDDTQLVGLSKITVGTVAPTAPAAGDLWVDTN
jgi:hypothetical protein